MASIQVQVLLVGWASKEGSRRKNWKRRYFILRTAHPDETKASGCTHTLVYYKTKEDATGPRAADQATPAGAVAITRNKTITEQIKKKIKGVSTQCICVKTSGRRDFFLSPDDPLALWDTAITTLEPPANAGDLRRQTLGDRPLEAVTLDDNTDAPVDEEEEGADDADRVATPAQKVAAAAKLTLLPAGLLTSLSEHGLAVHPGSDTQAVLAPEEVDRVPMLQRGVTLAFLQRMIKELASLGRGDIDCGQWLNGTHTTSSATDWKEYSRAIDALCGKACTLHSGTSFVETCIAAGFTHDPETGAAYFGPIDTFVSYTWRGEGITMASLVTSVQETLEADPLVTDINSVACFVDVFVCAQHRGVRPVSNSCPNATDVGKFEEVVNACTRLVLYCTPLANPKALTRVWCLYEIMSAIKRDRPVNVALSAADRAELHRLLYEDFDKLIALFSTIKSKQAEATFDTDRAMVFGWIKRDLGDDGFSILDQLVQVGMRQWLAEAALKLVRAREEAGEETEDTARLMAECGRLLTLLARYGEAEQLFRRALAMNERITGPDHINAAPILNCLGDLYRAQYRLQEAEPHYRKAAIMFLNAPTVGPNHWRTGLVIGELARTVKDLGRLDEADPLFRQSIAILAATRGPEHNDTATHMNNFAHLLMVKGQTTESAAMYRATLAILEKVHGPEHPSIGITTGNLADTLRQSGDVTGAEKLYRRALEITTAAFGENHPEVSTSINNLANCVKDKGDLDEAELLFRRALAIQEATHGPRGGDWTTLTNNLAALLYARGDFEQAVQMFSNVLEERLATVGPNHFNTAMTTGNLAGTLREMGQFDEAERHYTVAVATFESLVGVDHPNSIYIRANRQRAIQLRGDAESETGRAMIETMLEQFTSPPLSYPATHPWVVKLSKWVEDAPITAALLPSSDKP